MPNELNIKELSVVPFRFVGVHHCEAVVGMPMDYDFVRETLDFVESALCVKLFDVVGISAFASNLSKESTTLMESLKIASDNHAVRQVFIFKHMDSRKHHAEKRFATLFDEDTHHKSSLFASGRKIRQHHPHIIVRLFYVRIVSDGKELEFSEVFPDAKDRTLFVTSYKYNERSVEAAVVMCQDWRFRRESRALCRYSLGIDSFELIALPGASKSFHYGCEMAINSIKVAIVDHGCEKIVAIQHADCGAYGGSCAFGSLELEEDKFYGELKSFKEKIRNQYPQVEVIMVYARLVNDGTHIQFVQYLD